jgi:regulator of sirC expression with transglutaminase-like and TPR domain
MGMIPAVSHLGLLDDEDIALDLAALDLSALDHEGVSLDPYFALLKEMEDRLAPAAQTESDGLRQGRIMAELLAGTYDFSGDHEAYDAPLNADMIRVLDRRRGLPVSLSILYVALARRIGWIAFALNTPGHVLVRIGPPGAVVVIDPFNGGAPVPMAHIADLLAGALGAQVALTKEHLAPMSNRQVLVRLLLNQASRAERGGDRARARAIYERATTIAPAHAQCWWDLARLQWQTGQAEKARDSLSAMLEITRDPVRRAHIVTMMESIAR